MVSEAANKLSSALKYFYSAMLYPLSLQCFAVISSVAFTLFSSAVNASDEEASFTQQCPALFKVADNFAHECLQNARGFTRDFYPGGLVSGTPQTEEHAVYFRAVDSGSHFGLGCTLVKHKIRVVGVYYTTQSSNYTFANTAPIAYVDFQGNVGIKLDNRVVNFIPVRQFTTDFIPLTYGGRVKNCEASKRPDGRVSVPGADYFISEHQDHGEHIITRCAGDPSKGTKNDQGCESASYINFFPSKDRKIVDYEHLIAGWVIRNGGELDISKQQSERICHGENRDVGIVKEMCGQSGEKPQ